MKRDLLVFTQRLFPLLIGGLLLVPCPDVAHGQAGFGETITVVPERRKAEANWAGKMAMSFESAGFPTENDMDALEEGGLLRSDDALAFIGGVGPDGQPLPEEKPDRHNLWEVELNPGTFEIAWSKLPSSDIPNGEEHYLLVSFHTPDNIQYQMKYWKALRFVLPKFKLEKAEGLIVHKFDGAFDRVGGVVPGDGKSFLLEIPEATRVYFRTFRTIFRTVTAGRKPKFVLDPGPRATKYALVPEQYTCPIFLRWVPKQALYRMEVESYIGEFDLTDWMITVKYIE